MNRRLKAFTLAEILITLGIIAIVAALVMPQLNSKVQNVQLAAQFKKAATVMSQVVIKSSSENASYEHWDIAENNMTEIFKTHFEPYMEIIKKCGDAKEGCWTKTVLLDTTTTSNFFSYGIGGNIYTFTMKDGMNVNLDGWTVTDSYNLFGVTQDLPYALSVIVDVNGNKRPNIMGRDVFVFILTSKGLIPAGRDNDSASCVRTGGGYDCAARVLREGTLNY